VVTAMIREAREEAGIRLTATDLQPLGAVHTIGGDRPRVGFAFAADHDEDRHGAVVNAEPAKCDGLVWAAPDEPPQPLESYNAAVLELHNGQQALVLHGWPAR